MKEKSISERIIIEIDKCIAVGDQPKEIVLDNGTYQMLKNEIESITNIKASEYGNAFLGLNIVIDLLKTNYMAVEVK